MDKFRPMISVESGIKRVPSELPQFKPTTEIFPNWMTAAIILEQTIEMVYDVPTIENWTWEATGGLDENGSVLRKVELAPGQLQLHFGDHDYWLMVNCFPPEDKEAAQRIIIDAAYMVFRMDEVVQQFEFMPIIPDTKRKMNAMFNANLNHHWRETRMKFKNTLRFCLGLGVIFDDW